MAAAAAKAKACADRSYLSAPPFPRHLFSGSFFAATLYVARDGEVRGRMRFSGAVREGSHAVDERLQAEGIRTFPLSAQPLVLTDAVARSCRKWANAASGTARATRFEFLSRDFRLALMFC